MINAEQLTTTTTTNTDKYVKITFLVEDIVAIMSVATIVLFNTQHFSMVLYNNELVEIIFVLYTNLKMVKRVLMVHT